MVWFFWGTRGAMLVSGFFECGGGRGFRMRKMGWREISERGSEWAIFRGYGLGYRGF
jgi:hypothetical protein